MFKACPKEGKPGSNTCRRVAPLSSVASNASLQLRFGISSIARNLGLRLRDRVLKDVSETGNSTSSVTPLNQVQNIPVGLTKLARRGASGQFASCGRLRTSAEQQVVGSLEEECS